MHSGEQTLTHLCKYVTLYLGGMILSVDAHEGKQMKISRLIEELTRVADTQGDIEVTCTGSTLEDGHGGPIPDVFETTVGTLDVGEHPTIGKRVRLFL